MSDITWDDVENAMSTFVPTSGGYSLAKRGIIALANGQKVFVKLATEENSQRFIPKEIAAYNWLKEKGYKHMPELLLSRKDGIVLPDLSEYDWSDSWSEEKLSAVLKALDELNDIEITDEDSNVLQLVTLTNGWQKLFDDGKYLESLLKKLEGYPDLREKVQNSIEDFAKHTDEYYKDRSNLKLIHADVRADNLAYNSKTGEVLLVDWNWMGLGWRGIEDIGVLVNVAKSGFDVTSFCPERIDKDAALVLAGFWLFHCTEKIWEGGNPALRELQFQSGLQAFKWAL